MILFAASAPLGAAIKARAVLPLMICSKLSKSICVTVFACPICCIISSGTLAARVPKPVPTSTEESCQSEPVLFRSTLNRWIHFRSCRPSWSTPAQDTLIHRSPAYTLFLSSRALWRIYTEWVRRLPCLLSEFPPPDSHTQTSEPECRVFVSLV